MERNRVPLLSKIDCVQIPVPDLDGALAFYQKLGHELLWRTHDSIGLRLPDTETEIVLQKVRPEAEVDWLVESVDDAVGRFVAAGGSVEVGPFDIPIGRCVVVKDPWGNRLVLLDMRKGKLATDHDGNVVGNLRPEDDPARSSQTTWVQTPHESHRGRESAKNREYFDSIIKLVEYELWCNLRAIDFLGGLSDVELKRDFGFGLRTPHRTMFHIADVMQGWGGYVGPITTKPTWRTYDELMTLEEIRTKLTFAGQSCLAAAKASHDQGVLSQRSRLAHLIHLITHGTHHRGQLLSMVTLLGYNQPFEGGDFGGWSQAGVAQ
jgi:uncharacterized damage-inducible protein DinB/predicted enzyme related to lactoylglutathione lyase